MVWYSPGLAKLGLPRRLYFAFTSSESQNDKKKLNLRIFFDKIKTTVRFQKIKSKQTKKEQTAWDRKGSKTSSEATNWKVKASKHAATTLHIFYIAMSDSFESLSRKKRSEEWLLVKESSESIMQHLR